MELDPADEGTFAEVTSLLATCYGGTSSRYALHYDPTFLREQRFATFHRVAPMARGARDRVSGELVAFVLAIPSSLLVRGVALETVIVDLWCARPEVRGTGVARELIRRLIVDCQAIQLAEGALFTGRRLPFPVVGEARNWVRVLDAEPLRRIGLLGPEEQTPSEPAETTPRTVRVLCGADGAAAFDLYVSANAGFDVAPSAFVTPDIGRFLGGRGVGSWVLESRDTATVDAWFSLFTTRITCVGEPDHPPVRVANLWAFGARDGAAQLAAMVAAFRVASSTGHALFSSSLESPIPAPERVRLSIRPGPSTSLFTFGNVERYQGLTFGVPFT